MRSNLFGIYGVVLTSLTLCGCVKKTDYEALEGKHKDALSHAQQLEQEKQARDAAIASLEQALATETAKLAERDREIADLKSQLEASRARQVELQNQLTEMVKDSSKLKGSVEEMRKALEALEAQKRETQARVDEYKRLLASFKKLIDAGKLRVKIVDGRMVIELPSDILFASGSVDLSKDGLTAIREVGTIFAAMKDKRFQVEGHTDDQPIKTARFPSNWELAAGRAIAVTTVLIEAGVAPEAVSAASFGEFRPVASNASTASRKQNRRIEIVLVPDLSKVPGFAELERAVSK
jgi:chemotaxis protein MotB